MLSNTSSSSSRRGRHSSSNYLTISRYNTSHQRINMPRYAFPLLQNIYYDLQSQINANPNTPNLTINKHSYNDLKSILNRIDNNGFHIPIHTILFLIKRLQKAKKDQQQKYIKSILFIFDKFITIEKCLLLQELSDHTTLYKIDQLFDTWLERLIRTKISDDFLETFNESVHKSLDEILKNQNINLKELHKCLMEFTGDMTLQNGIFINIRNVFLIFARKFGLIMPPPLYTAFSIIQYCGDVVCKNIVNIDIVMRIFATFYVENENVLSYIRTALELYCAVNKNIQTDKLLRWVMKYLEENKRKKPYISDQELYEDAHKRMLELFERGSPNRPSEQEESKKLKKTSFFSKHSGTLTRSINGLIKRTEAFVEDKINRLNLDAETTAVLMGTMIAIKKSIQIEGWEGFIRSFNRHSRMMLGEKFPGKVPETPFVKLMSGKVFMRLNRNTFLANMTVLLPFAYPLIIKRFGSFIDN